MEVEGEILAFVLIFLGVSTAFYFVYQAYTSEPAIENEVENQTEALNDTLQNQSETTEPPAETEENVSDSFSNATVLHWAHMPITYAILGKEICQGTSLDNFKKALEIVEKETDYAVQFEETTSSADITVNCVNRDALISKIDEVLCKQAVISSTSIQLDGRELLGENDFLLNVTIVNRTDSNNTYRVCYADKSKSYGFDWHLLDGARIWTDGKLITDAEMIIYTSESFSTCAGFPAYDVHDILHAAGFAHSFVPQYDLYYGWNTKHLKYFQDIMFPYTQCIYKKSVDDKYTTCLKNIYSNGATDEGCEGLDFAD